MVVVVVDLENQRVSDAITLASFAKPRKVEKKICYETELGLSLEKRTQLLNIIREDNSWSNKQGGLYFTNLYAHHTQWLMHKDHSEFKELVDLVDNYLATSVLQNLNEKGHFVESIKNHSYLLEGPTPARARGWTVLAVPEFG